jgi:FkbM family methyltransferase
MSASTFLGRLFIAARRQPWVAALKKWLPASWRSYAWRRASSVDEIVVAGNRMRIPASERNTAYINDDYEPEVLATLRRLLRPGMTFCDVGANMGVITLLAARLVGPTGRVFAFEPMPENARVVRENVALNGFQNVTLIEAGIAEQNGEAQLHLSKYGGNHRLAESPGGSLNLTITVQTLRLDSVPGLDRIDVLKSDTEGTELAVLRSLGALKPGHVILEANADLFTIRGRPSEELTGVGFLRGLAALGYTVVENLTDPAAGVTALEQEADGCWNLLLQPKG